MNREKPRLCLVFPMGMEMGPFLDRVQPVRRWSHGKAAYREVFFEGSHVLVVRCGIGPERAASSLRNLGERPDIVVSVGTAGALCDDLRVGDLVIASDVVAVYESDGPLVSDPALVDLLALACAMQGKGFVALQREAGTHRTPSGDLSRDMTPYDAGDPSLTRPHQGVRPLAESLSQNDCIRSGRTGTSANPGSWSGAGTGERRSLKSLDFGFCTNDERSAGTVVGFKNPNVCLTTPPDRHRRHILARPGRSFCIDRLVTVRNAVFSVTDRIGLREETHAAAVDMETYALASVAKELGIHHACLRVISDDFSSPPMPLRRSPRISWNRPVAIPGDLRDKLRWSRFLKSFERSIAVLPPVLVRFIRELGRECKVPVA